MIIGGPRGEEEAPPPIRVMLVDDHALVREAVAATLERHGMLITAQAASAEQALGVLADAAPDVVLVDIELPGMRGINLVRELVPRLPNAIILMLTGSVDEEEVLIALRAGAAGFLTKDLRPEALARSVQGAVAGELAMTRRMARRVVRDLLDSERRHEAQRGGPSTSLTVREEEVITLVSAGLTDRAIGERLGISPRTVGHHLGNILDKLGVESRAAAARAWQAGAARRMSKDDPG